jgi:hypothetical protein
MPMPEELRIAYQIFTMLALKHHCLYAALMIQKEPLDTLIIGNVTERGHELANLLRMHADYIDKQTAAGNIATGEIPPNAN